VKNINKTILRYLYKHDNGEFLNIAKAFKKAIPHRDRLEHSFYELSDYIEKERADVFIWTLGYSIPEPNSEPLSKVRINQKGREYIDDQLSKEKTLSINNKALFLTILSVAVAIIGVLIAYLSYKL
jgi:hypothetical protein